MSFDRYEIKDLFINASIFSDFITILNSQSNYNKANGITSLSGIVNNAAVPLITFHNVRPVNNVPYTTNVGVFAELMKYLHDNGYKVLNMANLNSTAYANGGIPNGLVGMPNNPRGINPMHLAPPSLNPMAMLGTNMNNRQMQMSTHSPPIT